MALAMEERTTTKMLGRNNAIETLKREVEVLGGENTKLSAEVARPLVRRRRLRTFA
jgi:hypothetical protein